MYASLFASLVGLAVLIVGGVHFIGKLHLWPVSVAGMAALFVAFALVFPPSGGNRLTAGHVVVAIALLALGACVIGRAAAAED